MVFFLLLRSNIYAQGIPAFWYKSPRYFLTQKQLELIEQFNNSNKSRDQSAPPPFIPRSMAEWEENQGLLLSWGQGYSDAKHDVLCEIISYVLQEENIYIYIVCSERTSVENFLSTRWGIQSPRIIYLIESQLATIWSRDFGPITIYENYVDSFSFMDWKYLGAEGPIYLDGEVPQLLANLLEIQRYENEFKFEGGNFICDGHGTASST